jgi:hypothetical protein
MSELEYQVELLPSSIPRQVLAPENNDPRELRLDDDDDDDDDAAAGEGALLDDDQDDDFAVREGSFPNPPASARGYGRLWD